MSSSKGRNLTCQEFRRSSKRRQRYSKRSEIHVTFGLLQKMEESGANNTAKIRGTLPTIATVNKPIANLLFQVVATLLLKLEHFSTVIYCRVTFCSPNEVLTSSVLSATVRGEGGVRHTIRSTSGRWTSRFRTTSMRRLVEVTAPAPKNCIVQTSKPVSSYDTHLTGGRSTAAWNGRRTARALRK